MDIKDILSRCDHTLLSKTATANEICELIDDGIKYGCASVCIPPCFVSFAKGYMEGLGESIPICTVIGFPNGYNTTRVKVAETLDAVENGADEIDMVINIGLLKEKLYDELYNDIREVRKACEGKILKVIVETCLLTEEEIVKMCVLVAMSGADYIKTSTGFDKEGATFRAVELMSENSDDRIKIKAAGGIASLEDAEKFIALGADRLGTSRIVRIAKQNGNTDKEATY